jgi:hypothetical protein
VAESHSGGAVRLERTSPDRTRADGTRLERTSLDRIRGRLFNAETRRPWTAAVVGAAVFTPMFWLSVASGLGKLTVAHGQPLGAYPAAVVGLYFASIVLISPLLAHTAGYLLDRATSAWRRDDAVSMFVAFGVVLAAAAVSFVMALAPGGGAFVPALWLFGLPLVVTLGVTRFVIEAVLASRKWTLAAVAVAYAPVLLAALWLLGLYVGNGTVPG